jgi:hypothetical protein
VWERVARRSEATFEPGEGFLQHKQTPHPASP